MLPSSRRVSKVLFEKVMKESKVSQTPFLSMRIGRASDQVSRFSCIVSKKIDTRATRRNVLRRRVYAALIPLFPSLKPGIVVLLFAKKGLEALSVLEIEQQLQVAFAQATILLT